MRKQNNNPSYEIAIVSDKNTFDVCLMFCSILEIDSALKRFKYRSTEFAFLC